MLVKTVSTQHRQEPCNNVGDAAQGSDRLLRCSCLPPLTGFWHDDAALHWGPVGALAAASDGAGQTWVLQLPRHHTQRRGQGRQRTFHGLFSKAALTA